MSSLQKSNRAFIDSQNLHLATTQASDPWKIDMKKFRIYLQQKYHVDQAFCFMGAHDSTYQDMYTAFQRYGYILVFREHGKALRGKKKGNVDVDIVFEIMKELYEADDFNKIVLVSGDGDYKRLVDYLIKIGKFEKLLLPNKEYASSLYRSISHRYYDYIDSPAARVKFGYPI